MKTHLNLLSAGFIRRQIAFARLRQWTLIWLFAAVAGGAVIWVNWQGNREGAEKAAELQRSYDPVERKMSDIQSLKEKLAGLREREKLTLELSRERSVLTLLGYVSQAAQACDGNVSVQEFTLDRADGDAASTAAQVERVLSLSGVGTDNLALAQFIAGLRDAGVFTQVQLKSTGMTATGKNACWEYQLDCSF